MTEAQWLTGTDPRPLLDYAEVYLKAARTKVGRRKLRLFGCACCRRLWHKLEDGGRRSVELAERYADGHVSPAEMTAWAWEMQARPSGLARDVWSPAAVLHVLERRPQDCTRAMNYAPWVSGDWRRECAAMADLVRELWGNPFRPFPVSKAWLKWNTAAVPAMARFIYDERAFDRLPVLADALDDAGCDNADLLGHLRGPGPHVRGCWAVDLLLGLG